MLRELVEVYLTDSTTILNDIQAAIGRKDAESIQHAAHRLKGSSSVLDAAAVRAAAEALETMGAAKDLGGVDAAWARLQREATRLREVLRRPA